MTRRIAAALAALALLPALLAAGSAAAEGALRGYSKEDGYIYVTLGEYPQKIDGGEPSPENAAKWKKDFRDREEAAKKAARENTEYTDPLDGREPEREPILWRVLSADEEKIYLYSEYILFASPVHQNQKEFVSFKGDFRLTELHGKLNGEFLETAFTEAERGLLLETEELGTVFLASNKELGNKALGFGTNKSRKAWATEYAVRITGAFVYKPAVGQHTPYWTRTASTSDKKHNCCIKQDGDIGRINCITLNEGARPAVYLKPEGWTITGGSGTFEDPYTLTAEEQGT